MKKKIIFANRKTTIDGRQYPPKTTTLAANLIHYRLENRRSWEIYISYFHWFAI